MPQQSINIGGLKPAQTSNLSNKLDVRPQGLGKTSFNLTLQEKAKDAAITGLQLAANAAAPFASIVPGAAVVSAALGGMANMANMPGPGSYGAFGGAGGGDVGGLGGLGGLGGMGGMGGLPGAIGSAMGGIAGAMGGGGAGGMGGLSGMNSRDPMSLIMLQKSINDQSLEFTLRSNIMKTQHDMMMACVNNIR